MIAGMTNSLQEEDGAVDHIYTLNYLVNREFSEGKGG